MTDPHAEPRSLAKRSDPKPARIEQPQDSVEIGQWYWIQYENGHKRLGCVTQIGTNYVEVTQPGGAYTRVHMDEFDEVLTFEPDHQEVIEGEIKAQRLRVTSLLDQVKAITARLGVSSHLTIEHRDENSRALARLSGTENVDNYKGSLIRAKKEELPALFEKIKEANKKLAVWMEAETIPLRAMADQMKGCVQEIDDRIFNVGLYAGLSEDIIEVRGGDPADISEKLHLMQRRLYMDEECLLDYQAGGMDFDGIEEFDSWLAKSENADRILPFPRCVVAMRVRRSAKQRDWGGSLLRLFINIRLGELDGMTFLYIRNGERIYRMNCDLEFGEMLFPDRGEFDLSEPMMVKMFCSRVDEMMPVREYEALVQKQKEERRAYRQWKLDNPLKKWSTTLPEHEKKHGPQRAKWLWEAANPHNNWKNIIHADEWEPFDHTNVYYDECQQEMTQRIRYHNRIALIVQGLFDRSLVLHPHPPIQTWTKEGFDAAIVLVYDNDRVLYEGPKPDFEKYRARCNASISTDSILYGQEEFWERREAEKEAERLDRDWRTRSDYRPSRFRPFGNAGPGQLARPARWMAKSRRAVFRWTRERQRSDRWNGKRRGDPIPAKITVPVEHLFNVSAYKPGDYLQFFQDPRTREQYLKWAPILLTAENYYARKLEVQEPAID